ncbi:MAG: hypothetical protein GY862_00305 [Gammaproteobacteria bacterium]|nr:hypothetical protein [Gammaproteobacteria bacterium]
MRLDPDQLAAYQEAALVYQRRGEAEKALEYQTSLAALLVDEKITRLAKNQLPWEYFIDSRQISLYMLAEKRAYLYLSMAANACLLGRQDVMNKALRQAQTLPEDDGRVLAMIRSLAVADMEKAGLWRRSRCRHATASL